MAPFSLIESSSGDTLRQELIVTSKFSRRCKIITALTITIVMLALGLTLGLIFGLKHHTASAAPTPGSTSPSSNGTTPGSSSPGSTNTTDPGFTAGNITLTANLGYSTYLGANADNGVSQWFGIRYAQNPVGDLRFRAPVAPLTDGQTYQANTHGPLCRSTPSLAADNSHSEDCLFLDVYAPTAAGQTHPVFVFIQGGGFESLSNPNLDGNSLINAADHDLVIVTFNYRTGPYGFLAGKEVKAGGEENNGLRDQRMVLEWVQTNIAKFGGDPTRVTIGGASAGAASVDLQMTAFGGRDDGLFHQAAAESQSFGALFTSDEAQYQYDHFVNTVGNGVCNTTADTFKCLQGLDILDITDHNTIVPTPGGGGGNPVFMYGPVIDGNFTTDFTYNAFQKGNYVKVPLLSGDDTNEGTIFTPDNVADTADEMKKFLKNNFRNITSADFIAIDNAYPISGQFSGKSAFWSATALAYGEMRYNCPSLYAASQSSSAGNQNWVYHWDVVSSADAADGDGATHTAELPSIWGYQATSPQQDSNAMMQAYWTSFIRTGDPNTLKLSSAPIWGTFSTTSKQRMHFVNDPSQAAMETVDQGQQTRCSMWNSLGAKIQQ